MDNNKIKTTDIGKLMVKIDANTRILTRRLEVIKSGKVILNKIKVTDNKTKSVICSECNCEYLYRD